MLETIEINPKSKAKTSVIWLHGLGADNTDFVDIAETLDLHNKFGTRIIFPNAPLKRVAIANGSVMRAWFNIDELHEDSVYKYATDIHESQQLINELIDNEIQKGIPSDKIAIAGFSQGGALSLYCGLRYPSKLAGILVLSGFLPLANALENEINDANKNVEILMLHGTLDEIVIEEWAKTSYKKLIDLGLNAKWQSYNMPHTICHEEINTISTWFDKIF